MVQFRIALHHVATYYSMWLKCVILCEVQIVGGMARSWDDVFGRELSLVWHVCEARI